MNYYIGKRRYNMLISVQEFLDSGLRVSSDVTEKEIEFAINTCENFYVKNRLTQDHYNDLLNNQTTEPNKTLLIGGTIDGVTYAGVKAAEFHLCYAYLMTDNMRVTRYSTMEKNSEFSKNSNREDILEQARLHWNVGISFLNEVMTYYNLETEHNNGNNLFETIYW